MIYTLKDVFNEFSKNNIYVNLDDTYILTFNKKKPAYNDTEFFGYIESVEDNDNDILECLNEEGSASINYRFISTSRTFYKKTIIVILQSIFTKFGFDPFITKNKKDISIELIITKNNLTDEYKSLFIKELSDIEEENEDEEDEEDDEDEEDEEDDEDEEDEEDDEEENEDDEEENEDDEEENEDEEDEDEDEVNEEENEEDEKEDEDEDEEEENEEDEKEDENEKNEDDEKDDDEKDDDVKDEEENEEDDDEKDEEENEE